jgi:hypothetical protein
MEMLCLIPSLNTFIALKMDNERLQQRLARLKMLNSSAPSSGASLPRSHQYATPSSSSQRLSDISNPLFQDSGPLDWDNRPQGSSSRAVYDNSMNYPSSAHESRIQASCSKPTEEDASDEGSRKKKVCDPLPSRQSISSPLHSSRGRRCWSNTSVSPVDARIHRNGER